AAAAALRMGTIWNAERVGLKVSGVIVKTASTSSDTSSLASVLDFECKGPSDCKDLDNLHKKVGDPEGGMLNIYYVTRVDYGSGLGYGNGVWCGDNTVVVGSLAMPDLMVHEVGHAFGLYHIDGLGTAYFDQTNVMYSSSSSRAYFAEGQTFRVFS